MWSEKRSARVQYYDSKVRESFHSIVWITFSPFNSLAVQVHVFVWMMGLFIVPSHTQDEMVDKWNRSRAPRVVKFLSFVISWS